MREMKLILIVMILIKIGESRLHELKVREEYSNRTCNILALSGGGAHGSFQAGVLKRYIDVSPRWDVITGVSAGSLNGAIIALYDKIDQYRAIMKLEQLWMNMTSKDIYRYNLNPVSAGSIMSSEPLRNLITRVMGELGHTASRPIIVGTTSMNDGSLKFFDSSNIKTVYDAINIVMASTAIPVYFPPVRYNDEMYIDGGVFSNELVDAAIDYCESIGKKKIVIDVIVCSQPIKYISTRELQTYTLVGISKRDYAIANNALFNHELYGDCKYDENPYPMYVYEPNKTFTGTVMDFSKKQIKDSFKIGLQTDPVKLTYCH